MLVPLVSQHPAEPCVCLGKRLFGLTGFAGYKNGFVQAVWVQTAFEALNSGALLGMITH